MMNFKSAYAMQLKKRSMVIKYCTAAIVRKIIKLQLISMEALKQSIEATKPKTKRKRVRH